MLWCRIIVPVALLFSGVEQGRAEEVSLSDLVPLKSGLTYNLEVSKDEAFQRVIVKKNLRGKNLTFNLNEEYSYFWKLTPESSMTSSESSASASGSFIFLKGKNPLDQSLQDPIPITWATYPDATDYRITIADLRGHPRAIMTTAGVSVALPRTPTPMLVFVEPFKNGNESLFDTFSILPGLSIKRDKNLAPSVTVKNTEAPETGEVQEQIANTPEPTEAEPPPPPTNASAVTASESASSSSATETNVKPWHRLNVYEAYFFDNVKLSRGNAEIDFDDQAFGGGLSFHTQPLGGFFVAAQFDYHDLETVTNITGVDSPPPDFGFKAPRVNFTGGIGIDVLGFTPKIPHHLSIRGIGGLISLPFFPDESSLDNLTKPPQFKIKQIPLAGGGVSYRFFRKNLSLGLDYQFLVSDKRTSEINSGQISLEFYIAKKISVLLAFQGRQINSKTCAQEELTCDAVGTVNTRVMENSIAVGIGNYRL